MFYLAAFLMIVAAVLIFIPALFRPPPPTCDAGRQNIAAAKSRLAELGATRDDLSEPMLADYRGEIGRLLLDDMTPPSTPPAKRGIIGSLVALLLLPVLAAGLYLHLGTPPGRVSATHPPTLAAAADSLRRRLAEQPDNGDGWRLLAKTMMTLERYEEAAAAFAEARRLRGDSPALLSGHLDALLTAGRDDGEIRPLLEKSLALHPDHPPLLWLAGKAARNRGDLDAAIAYWRQAERLLADSPQQLEEIRRLISDTENPPLE